MGETPIKPPQTYAEWTVLLDMLKKHQDDEAVLDAMQKGSIAWQSGVAERFSKRLIDTVNARMDEATDKFQREITRSMGQERNIVSALLALRKELAFLIRATDLPVLPEKDRQHYTGLIRSHAGSIQRSLDDSAKTDRTGRLSSIIRNNKVDIFGN